MAIDVLTFRKKECINTIEAFAEPQQFSPFMIEKIDHEASQCGVYLLIDQLLNQFEVQKNRKWLDLASKILENHHDQPITIRTPSSYLSFLTKMIDQATKMLSHPNQTASTLKDKAERLIYSRNRALSTDDNDEIKEFFISWQEFAKSFLKAKLKALS